MPNAGPAAAAPVDCETAVRRLWDYLDGRLPARARGEVEAHLAACAVCPPHFAFARAIRGALAASAPPAADPDEARLRERVRRALRRHAADDGPGADGLGADDLDAGDLDADDLDAGDLGAVH